MKPIDRTSRTDAVVRELREALESGRYAMGDKFATERELSEELGVGRSTVREALRMLQAHGYIELKAGRGAFVKQTAEGVDAGLHEWFATHEFQLLDFMEVRNALEPLAVRLCIERATDEEIAGIAEIQRRFEVALAQEDAEGLAAADEALHSSITAASHNRLLQPIEQVVAGAFREYRVKAFSVKGNARNALEPHRRIVAAIQDRDASRASKEVLNHLDISREDIHRAVVAAGANEGKGGN